MAKSNSRNALEVRPDKNKFVTAKKKFFNTRVNITEIREQDLNCIRENFSKENSITIKTGPLATF